MVDLLIENGRILTPSGWTSPGYLSIQAGQVSELGEGSAPEPLRQSANQIISAEGMAVLPGLTNAHTHLSQTLMRGLASGRSLIRWLKELVWPLQAAMGLEELKLAAQLGLAENLRCGVTHVVDHQKINHTPEYSLTVAETAEQMGIRLTLARAWTDKGANAEDPAQILKELEALFGRYQRNSMVKVASGPLTPWRTTGGTLQKAHSLARRYGANTHIHVSETRDEVEMVLKESGMRPVAWLESLGILSPECSVVHAVWVDEEEIRMLAKSGAPVVHCPVSNAVIASGMAPVYAMQQAGIEIWLGTDGPASNDTQDPFENMKMALSTARMRSLDPTHLSPTEVLRMSNGRKTLSCGDPADLILVDLRSLNAAPVHDIDSALVLCCRGSDVDTVIIGGKVLVRQKKLCGLDQKSLVDECEAAVASLRKRAGVN